MKLNRKHCIAAALAFAIIMLSQGIHAQSSSKIMFDVNANGYIITAGTNYGCYENNTVFGNPSFAIIGSGEARQVGAETQITQSGGHFYLALTSSCAQMPATIEKITDVADKPYEGIYPVKYVSQITAYYPFDLVGSFSESGVFTVNAERLADGIKLET